MTADASADVTADVPCVRPWCLADRDDLVDLVKAARRADPVYAAAIGVGTGDALAWLGMEGAGQGWVVAVDGLVVGTVQVARSSPPRLEGAAISSSGEVGCSWELRRLLVHPNYQRRGLGGVLVGGARAWVEDRGVQIWLSCRAPLVPLYEHLGWRVAGELTFTSTGLPGYWMAPQ